MGGAPEYFHENHTHLRPFYLGGECITEAHVSDCSENPFALAEALEAGKRLQGKARLRRLFAEARPKPGYLISTNFLKAVRVEPCRRRMYIPSEKCSVLIV